MTSDFGDRVGTKKQAAQEKISVRLLEVAERMISTAAPHDILDLGRCNCSAPKAQGISGGVLVPLAA